MIALPLNTHHPAEPSAWDMVSTTRNAVSGSSSGPPSVLRRVQAEEVVRGHAPGQIGWKLTLRVNPVEVRQDFGRKTFGNADQVFGH